MCDIHNKEKEERINEIGENHIGTSAKTPLRADAFDISDEEKIAKIQDSVKDILETLGMDLNDDSLQGTPKRVAKAFVNEIFMGLNPKNMPKASTFDNNYNYVLVNTIYCQLLAAHMWPIFLMEK